jgi:hypothetical protein
MKNHSSACSSNCSLLKGEDMAWQGRKQQKRAEWQAIKNSAALTFAVIRPSRAGTFRRHGI